MVLCLVESGSVDGQGVLCSVLGNRRDCTEFGSFYFQLLYTVSCHRLTKHIGHDFAVSWPDVFIGYGGT